MKLFCSPKISTFFKIIAAAVLVYFFSWFFAYKTGMNELVIQSEDTLPAIFMPVTIIKEGTIYLDSYYDMLLERYPHPDDKDYEKGLVPFYLREIPLITLECDPNPESPPFGLAHYISAFPIITPLLALPIYFFPVVLGVPITWETLIILSHVSSAFIIAFSGGFLYLLLEKHFFKDGEGEKEGFLEGQKGPFWKKAVLLLEQKPLLLTAIYLFGTINYAHISQALWQHGTVQLFTILALYALYEKRHILTGLFFGLMLLSRPTSAIAVGLLGLLGIFFKYNLANTSFKQAFADAKRRNARLKEGVRYLIKLITGLTPAILFFLWYNSTFYKSIANQGYSNQIFTEWKGRFPEGFLGLWLSPSKGILVYSPILIFSLYGIYQAFKYSKKNFQYLIFSLIVIIHILVLGFWKHWYGGWSFGYRMASDVLPFLVLLLVPSVKSNLFKKFKTVFYLLFGFSVLVQVYGIVFFDGVWHAAYDLGYQNTSWLWSVENSELAFNIRRILVKLNLRTTPF